jgi:capsular exopolysaccharide synthesis family protein
MVVVLRWVLSSKFQSDRQVRRAVGPLPLWAAIPHDDLLAKRAFRTAAPPAFAPGSSPAFAEAFRHLRTSLYCDAAQDCGGDGGGGGDGDRARAVANKIVVVTSPGAGDGKTLCTISLAAALATDGKRVLVVEADMHRPSLGALLPIRPRGELAELLAGRQSWFDVVTAVPVGKRSFDVIAGRSVHADSAELLSSPRFAEILDHATSRYDFVLIDSPPFPLLSDALILSMQAGRVISVLRLGNTTRHAAEKHLHGLAVATARHGVIINDAVADSAVDAYYQPRHARIFRPDISKDQRASAPAA